jgi:type I restriction enzyme S subunit
METTTYKLGEVLDNFDYLRKPLSSMERASFQGEYPYYGAQGIIDYVREYRCDGTYMLIAEDGENLSSRKEPIALIAKGKFWVNNHAHIVKTNKLADLNYICYLLNHSDIAGYITGSAQPKLSQGNLNKIKISLPALPLQRRIASILSSYDNLIEANSRRIKILEQMAENLYKEWFVRFRFPGYDEVEIENGLPKGWPLKKLGEFIKFDRGVGYGSKDIEDGENVLLSMNNIRPYGGFIRDYSRPYNGKYKDFQKVKKGDLIMSITDMTQDRRIIGYTGIVPPGKDNRVICTHLIKLSSEVSHSYFLNGLFNYSNLSRSIAERATGANVLGLTADILKNVKTLLPPIDLQLEYVKIVTPIIEKCFILQDQSANLTRQRDLLLPRLMSGQLTPLTDQ